MRELFFLFLMLWGQLCWASHERREQEVGLGAHTEIPPQLVAVSASEATLLTPPPTGPLMDFTLDDQDSGFSKLNKKSASPSPQNDTKTNRLTKSRYKIAKIFTNCSRSSFEMHIEMNLPFHGLLYAKEFPQECRARGTSETNITLRLPTSGCGVRVEPRSDGSMELSVRIMMQMEEKLRQSSDILRTVKCMLPQNAMGMNLSMDEERKLRGNSR